MIEIDAAALRSKSDAGYRASWDDVFALLDALEKARGDLEELVQATTEQTEACIRLVEASQAMKEAATTFKAERDAVRALLREALPWVGHMSDNPDIGLRARIAAELEPKP